MSTTIETLVNREYQYGFTTDIESDTLPPGLSEDGEKWAIAAPLLKKANLDTEYLEFGRAALQAGYRDSYFAATLTEDALNNNDFETARLAIEQAASFTSETDCSELRKLSEQYTQLKDSKKSTYYEEKATHCEQQKRKQERSANREGGLYVGAYLFPLFKLNYGAVASIHTKKVILEASYLIINDKRDRLSVFGDKDKAQDWSGYYAHAGIYGITGGKRGARTYTGPLFGYNYREYNDITTNVYDSKNSVPHPNETYKPKHEQYILMWNSGAHANGKILAADFFVGMGAAYNKFDRGGLEGEEFTYNNKLLQDRKGTYVSFIARFGVTIGLQIGPRTFQ